jgi:ribosomal protein S27E
MPDPFLVAIRCPQCGAETDFPEGAHALGCAYCGVALRVIGAHRGGRASFVMPPTLTADRLPAVLGAYARETGRRLDSIEWRTLVVAPYWRARGMALRWAYTSSGGARLAERRAVAVAEEPGAIVARGAEGLHEQGPSVSPRAGLAATVLEKAARLLVGFKTRTRGGSSTLLDRLASRDDLDAGPSGPPAAEAPRDSRHFDSRHVDLSFPAYADADLGLPSLGVRPSARPLRVLAPDALPEGALALPPALDAAAALARVADQSAAQFPETEDAIVVERTASVTSSLSAVYFPVWAASVILDGAERLVVVDAVAGSVSREAGPSEPWFAEIAARRLPRLSAASLGFLPLRCPECGWALPLEQSAVVHLCTRCGRAWAEGADRLVPIGYDAISGRGDALYLPVWRFEAAISVEGTVIAGAADLPRLFKPAGWPVPARPDVAGRPAALFVPAFECRALTVLERLAGALARLQPEIARAPEGEPPIPLSPTPRCVGASLEVEDAAQVAHLFLAGLVPGSGPAARKRLGSLSATLGPGRLLWLPAQDRGQYVQDRLTGVSLPKASLGWPADGTGRVKGLPKRPPVLDGR